MNYNIVFNKLINRRDKWSFLLLPYAVFQRESYYYLLTIGFLIYSVSFCLFENK